MTDAETLNSLQTYFRIVIKLYYVLIKKTYTERMSLLFEIEKLVK